VRWESVGSGYSSPVRGRPSIPATFAAVFLHPAAAVVGVKIGGWHDFRHTLTRMMRRASVNAVVVSGTLGHKKVGLAAEAYDRASSTDIGQALSRSSQTVATNRATKSVRELRKMRERWQNGGPTRI
jgi:integrase